MNTVDKVFSNYFVVTILIKDKSIIIQFAPNYILVQQIKPQKTKNTFLMAHNNKYLWRPTNAYKNLIWLTNILMLETPEI